jgi:hypothetical protein
LIFVLCSAGRRVALVISGPESSSQSRGRSQGGIRVLRKQPAGAALQTVSAGSLVRRSHCSSVRPKLLEPARGGSGGCGCGAARAATVGMIPRFFTPFLLFRAMPEFESATAPHSPRHHGLPHALRVERGEQAVVLAVPDDHIPLLFRQWRALERARLSAASERDARLIDLSIALVYDVYTSLALRTDTWHTHPDVVALPAPGWDPNTLRRYSVTAHLPNAGPGHPEDDVSPEADDLVWILFTDHAEDCPVACVEPSGSALRVEIDAPSEEAARGYVAEALRRGLTRIPAEDGPRYQVVLGQAVPIPMPTPAGIRPER